MSVYNYNNLGRWKQERPQNFCFWYVNLISLIGEHKFTMSVRSFIIMQYGKDVISKKEMCFARLPLNLPSFNCCLKIFIYKLHFIVVVLIPVFRYYAWRPHETISSPFIFIKIENKGWGFYPFLAPAWGFNPAGPYTALILTL